jgi:hypothetical protein
MKINHFLLIFLFAGLFFSCKKEFKQSQFDVILVEGDNQAGNPNEKLPNDVVIAVLRDGAPFANSPVSIEVEGGTFIRTGTTTFGNNLTGACASHGLWAVRIYQN